ncbi:MAG: DUF5700 domain-containing putative Zn-dependent protease [Thermoanaerobaculia bacterium]
MAIAATSMLSARLGLAAESSVSMNTDEAEAVLSILEKRAAGDAIGDADWRRLFESEPYVRLKKREASMKREFTDDEFRAFVVSPELVARSKELRSALDGWSSVDVPDAVARASAYLPPGVAIRGTIYPVIKPKTNSFVFEVDTNPAIFMYLDPAVAREKLANTLAHELHHIGFGTRCPSGATDEAIAKLPPHVAWVVARLGAFGEGFAMLAAASGSGEHPHAASSKQERERWDRDVRRVAADMRTIEVFFIDATSGRLTDEERQATFFSFYGEQGPWYTVGWLMARTIETELGRPALLDAFCDPRRLLEIYNTAATKANGRSDREALPLWSKRAVELPRVPAR